MPAHAYTEGQLVEQPAIGLFAELGWQVARPPINAGVAGEPADAGLLGAGGTRNPNRMNTAAVAISVIGPVSPAGEMAYSNETAWPRVAAIPGLPFYLKQPFYCAVNHSL